MAYRPLALTLALALPLAACSSGPDYRPRAAGELGVPDGYSVAADQRAQEDLTRWWGKFDDPQLASLVERARVANLDIALDRKSTRLNSSHQGLSRMPSSA